MERETFVFYKDWLNVIRDLPSEVQLEVYQAITEYAIYGNLIELKPLAKVAFGFVKQTIDRDTQKYISIKEKRKEAGAKGGRPLKTNELEESKDKQKNQLVFEKSKKSKSPLNVNVNDNVNDISFLEKKKQKSTSVDFGEGEKNNQPLNAQKETSPPVAPAPPPDSEESKKTKKRFVPPTPEEVQNYCNERGNGISGTEFCDFYISKGWKVGREPMKDWKAAVRTWEAKRKNNTQTNQTITIDENGNRITNAGNSNTNTSTPYVFGRQTAEDLRANLSGW